MAKQAILCVDDEKIILDSLKVQLKENFGHNYYYEFAENAEDAMDILNELIEQKMDVLVIVSDWLMPGQRGDDLLINIHQKYPNIVKIMLTGQADENAITRAKQYAGLHKCIFKPWDEEDLINNIKAGLDKL